MLKKLLKEKKIVKLFENEGLCPNIYFYLKISNYIVSLEKYQINSEVLTNQKNNILDDTIMNLVIKSIIKINFLELVKNSEEIKKQFYLNSLINNTFSYLKQNIILMMKDKLINTNLDDPTEIQIFESFFDNFELQQQKNYFQNNEFLFLSHSDIHGSNILYDKESVLFIDFENLSYGPIGWDFACYLLDSSYDLSKDYPYFTKINMIEKDKSKILKYFKMFQVQIDNQSNDTKCLSDIKYIYYLIKDVLIKYILEYLSMTSHNHNFLYLVKWLIERYNFVCHKITLYHD